jgi:lysophospholipase L1-like esterase
MLTLLLVAAAHAACPPSGACTIMPLGDSITDGYNVPGGYRVQLASLLAAGGDSFDFVGGMRNGPMVLKDKDHEGHSGWRIDQIDSIINSKVLRYQPDVVLIHLGTNDVGQDYDLANAPARLSDLVGDILTLAPDTTIVVASIIPLTSPAYEARGVAFNAQVPGVVQSWSDAGYDVRFVDMHAALNTWNLADGVHPNAGGYALMGNAWYAALADVLP